MKMNFIYVSTSSMNFKSSTEYCIKKMYEHVQHVGSSLSLLLQVKFIVLKIKSIVEWSKVIIMIHNINVLLQFYFS